MYLRAVPSHFYVKQRAAYEFRNGADLVNFREPFPIRFSQIFRFLPE